MSKNKVDFCRANTNQIVLKAF